MEDNRFSLVELVKILVRWKKHIIIVCSAAVIGSAIISLLMPNYYKSTAIFYPYNPKLQDPRTLYVKDLSYHIFAQSEDLDRIIMIANSSLIHRDIIREFGLVEHYKIDTTSKGYLDEALLEFDDNFEIIKNDRGALELTIYDTDRMMAQEIVKVMVGKINYINLETTRKNNEKLLEVYQNHTTKKEEEIKILQDSLGKVRNKFETYAPLSKLSLSGTSDFNKNKGVDEILKLENQITKVNEEYLEVKENYLQTASTLKGYVQSLFIVEEALTPEKKSKPIRWLIVTSSFLIALFFSTLFAVIIDFYKREVKDLLN